MNINKDLIKGSSDVKLILEKLFPIIRICGLIALQMQGSVSNIGKDYNENRKGDSERLKNQKVAKTKVDEMIQDIILMGIEDLDFEFSIDAEEDSFFNTNDDNKILSDNIFVIDPIDGTLEYLEGKDRYSICFGRNKKGFMTLSIVYFPARDILYFSTDIEAYIVSDFLRKGFENLEILKSENHINNNTIYYNNRIDKEVLQQLEKKGYKLISDEYNYIGVPDSILKCLNGESICYLSHTRQVRDILLGDIISKTKVGFAYDWEGNELVWPYKKRISRAIFGIGSFPNDIISSLK